MSAETAACSVRASIGVGVRKTSVLKLKDSVTEKKRNFTMFSDKDLAFHSDANELVQATIDDDVQSDRDTCEWAVKRLDRELTNSIRDFTNAFRYNDSRKKQVANWDH